MLNLTAVQAVVPDHRPSLFTLADRYDMPRAELAVFHRIYGLDRVPVWSGDTAALVEETVANLLKESGVDAGRVRWLVHAHTGTHQDVVGRAGLARICRRLGLDRAQSFGMTTNNCASTVSAMRVVDRLLARGSATDVAVVVTADVAFTPIMQVIPNSSVTGDAGVACLFSRRDPGHRVLAARIDTYGRHAACQWQDEAANAEFEAEYPARLADVMRRALDDAGLTWPDVRLVLPHNVNTFSWKQVAARAGIPIESVYLDQVPHTAHCFGADIFLNLAAADRAGLLRPGDRLMLATVGLGAVFAAVVLEYGSHR
ncbi:3-oxoacyl-[acyl-carrier-protein] synthase III C-terminal domain-containing protein [Micromonospora sp. WMMA1947]|uniref:3-oxoacyl-[acyl-carrier-protein] synthase III C-terminal domain-containing protein n=1 Tax=Micromonospora sp. WMMA1947 TaxID=3015163 RepID=UPI00248AE5D9|nr:3-oxoacyl-[acyl-carrier-protein] synthase III C-terminal domain-containing protein [Micromonospora sp. WMMA1947]WBC07643.1 3-oxoacyl-ACP synthase [Micromonospora sp. WMMA1947]